MKARTILNELLRADVMLEYAGIIKVHEEMRYTDFIRQYLAHDFEDKVLDHYRFVASEGEYFYCWFGAQLDFGQPTYIHYIDGQFLHVVPMDDEESEED